MSEDQVERRVEHRIDALDRRYMAEELTDSEYEESMIRIDRWAREQTPRHSINWTPDGDE